MSLWEFWRKCFKWAYKDWEGKEPLMAYPIIAISSLLAIIGIVLSPIMQSLLTLLALIPLIVTIVVYAPYRLYIIAQQNVEKQKTELEANLKSQIDKLSSRLTILEDERIPHITVSTFCAKRSEYESGHLMWSELRVCNTSPSLTLNDAQVRIISCLEIISYFNGNSQAHKNDLYDRGNFSPISVIWSERDVSPPNTKTDIAPNLTKSAVIAYQDNSNGETAILNAPSSPPSIIGGARIKIEVSGSNSATFTKDFYIECHGNILTKDGTIPSEFEFEEWDKWIKTHEITNLQDFDKEDSQL